MVEVLWNNKMLEMFAEDPRCLLKALLNVGRSPGE
jgi:hypothetical protein